MIPTGPRVEITHAAIQQIARVEGARALHIKGPAVHPDLLPRVDGIPVPRSSTDADVLIEPRKAQRVYRRLHELGGWTHVNSFTSGSPFGHAAAIWHVKLGYADLHRWFPGIGIPPKTAFEKLWADRIALELGHHLCWAPSVDHQRLILLLHAARSGGAKSRDVQVVWHDADDATRARIRELAQEFRAELPLAAAIGELEQHRGDRRHELWHQFSTGDQYPRSAEWRARIKAARNPADAVMLAVRSFMVNPDWLATQLGHQPTKQEIRQAWVRRIKQAVDETIHRKEQR